MEKPKIGQRVLWKNTSVPEEERHGQVWKIGPDGVWIQFKARDPQKSVRTWGSAGGGGTGVKMGMQEGNKEFFSWDKYERELSEEK